MRNVTLKFYKIFVFSVLHNFARKILCEITMLLQDIKEEALGRKTFLDIMFDSELIKK